MMKIKMIKKLEFIIAVIVLCFTAHPVAAETLGTYGDATYENSETQEVSQGENDANIIDVSFTLIGDDVHGTEAHTAFYRWIANEHKQYVESDGKTALDLIDDVFSDYEFKRLGSDSYILGIVTSDGITLSEKMNGGSSGWMYSVNGASPSSGVKGYVLKDGDAVQLYYVHSWNEAASEVVDKTYAPTVKNVDDGNTLEQAHENVIQYIYESVKNPTNASIGGEWAVLSLARSGVTDIKWYRSYYNEVVELLEERQSNKLSSVKSTENSRVVIALTAIGANAADMEGYNLLKPLADFDYVGNQGLNGYVYALIAFNCGKYEIPKVDEGVSQTTEEKLIEAILTRKLDTGGWSLTGEVADADITAMALQALAPYYNLNEDVTKSVDEALKVLSDMQKDDGTFANIYAGTSDMVNETVSSESCAQVLCALSVLGIDGEIDERFIKNNTSVLDALLSFADTETGGFLHTSEGEVNLMATEQAAYALTAYSRLKNQQNGLYDMSDATCLYECKSDAHVWDKGTVIKEATVETKGEKLFACQICGETKVEEIAKLTSVVEDSTIQNPVGEQTTEEEKKTTGTSEGSSSISTPKKTSVRTVKSSKKKQLKVTWKKKSGVTGYEIQISTSSKFKKSKTKTYKVKKQKTTSKSIKALKSGKKYYVRIRTYKTAKVNGKKITKYSTWSAKKSVKVK
jgi:hypothetical protein